MKDSLLKVQDVFLDKINPICKRFGLSHIMAQLYTILYFSDKVISLNDMMDRLNISKGSASTNIRALERYGAVKRVWVRGSRKDFYEADRDLTKLIKDRIRALVEERLSEIDDMLKTSYEILNSADSKAEENESFRKKLDKINDIYNQAKALSGLFNSTLLNDFLANGTNGRKND